MQTITLVFALFTAPAHAYSWNSSNSPANLNKNYQYQFQALPLSGEVNPKHMPWSDNYWESDWGGISLRWNTLSVNQRDPDLFDYQTVNNRSLFQYVPPSLAKLKTMSRAQMIDLSPAEKFDIFMGRYDYPTVNSERARTSPNMSDWQGLCHGWVPAAINHAEPLPVDITNADGVIIPFGSSDVKGLFSYYYGVTAYDFARGARKIIRQGDLFQVLNQIDSFDPFSWLSLPLHSLVYNFRGRQMEPSSLTDAATCINPLVQAQYGSLEKCQLALAVDGTVDELNLVGQVGERGNRSDPNAGAFFVVMTNQLGLQHEAFAANLNRFARTSQIWNQPVTSYTNHIDWDQREARGGQVAITTTLNFVTEIPQSFAAVVGTPAQRFNKMVFSYVLDIDSNGEVTGGNWTAGTHPSFLWKHGALPLQGYFSKLNQIYQVAP